MRTVDFTDKAYSDIDYFKKSGNTVILRKINSLIQNILESPFEGIGKPEPLKYELSGLWSRRINLEHQIIYEVLDETIVILSLRGHY